LLVLLLALLMGLFGLWITNRISNRLNLVSGRQYPRRPAQRCAQAARDTTGLIEDSIAKSNDGKTRLDHVTVAVRSITESANEGKTLVEEVKFGGEEQARGIEQVAKALVQMESVTQSTAAAAEESASASEELSAQSKSLRDILARLESMVDSGTNSPAGVAQH
jgi:methyl-accepting chemotaxis protein/methyl-accepting chemotaxis protein-1 (serine sensor receptor)